MMREIEEEYRRLEKAYQDKIRPPPKPSSIPDPTITYNLTGSYAAPNIAVFRGRCPACGKLQ